MESCDFAPCHVSRSHSLISLASSGVGSFDKPFVTGGTRKARTNVWASVRVAREAEVRLWSPVSLAFLATSTLVDIIWLRCKNVNCCVLSGVEVQLLNKAVEVVLCR